MIKLILRGLIILVVVDSQYINIGGQSYINVTTISFTVNNQIQ